MKSDFNPPQMQQIAEIIAKYHNIPIEQIFDHTRERKSVFYRQLFYYLTKETYRNLSFRIMSEFVTSQNPELCQVHATLMNGIKKVEFQMSYDKQFQQDVKNLKEIIRNKKEPAIVVKFVDLVGMCAKTF